MWQIECIYSSCLRYYHSQIIKWTIFSDALNLRSPQVTLGMERTARCSEELLWHIFTRSRELDRMISRSPFQPRSCRAPCLPPKRGRTGPDQTGPKHNKLCVTVQSTRGFWAPFSPRAPVLGAAHRQSSGVSRWGAWGWRSCQPVLAALTVPPGPWRALSWVTTPMRAPWHLTTPPPVTDHPGLLTLCG